MPISRGKSIFKSHWIRDLGEFYGENIFLAETSATSGGLDSLLAPHGPIKSAVYMDPYPLREYTMYGAVTLHEIKRNLLELKRAGKLDRVRMLLLTNCTFDGIRVGLTGMDGDTLRSHLMDRYDIQINKTSRNTVLFMINIGTSRGGIAYLLEVLGRIVRELGEKRAVESALERRIGESRVNALTKQQPPMPNFSRFHARFSDDSGTIEGDLRAAFFLGRSESSCDFLRLDGQIQAAMREGADLVSADWSQLVIKHTGESVECVTAAPASGIWTLTDAGAVEFVRPQTHRRTARDERNAFWLRIAGVGDYFYEGADLGILVTPGRLMDDDFALTDRAKAWIAGIRAQYSGRPLQAQEGEAVARVAEVAGFKFL